MDRSEAKAIVDRELVGLTETMGIGHWRITVRFERLDDADETLTILGDCTTMPERERAFIRIDFDEHDDEKGLLETLRHELFHVVLSPMDLYRAAVRAWLGDDATAAESVAWRHAVEMAVRNLERSWPWTPVRDANTDDRSDACSC